MNDGRIKFAAILLAIYTVLYFGVALMTSATFKDIAALEIAGLPLAVWGGLLIIVSGVIITRLYLRKLEQLEEGAN
ncbi:universal stress protein UspA [Thiomicrospira microaerophila]|uniref:universal stress protein UspA n=1 Tax=Thiomicrospira microaerophila TaxID=406020 RepID=UPI002010C67C|nr:universal stress protein UspA [Thiomicrospira microaerophila]UQB43046.1 universal stress protein UspA [Thiomicrospira microaerophila]